MSKASFSFCSYGASGAKTERASAKSCDAHGTWRMALQEPHPHPQPQPYDGGPLPSTMPVRAGAVACSHLEREVVRAALRHRPGHHTLAERIELKLRDGDHLAGRDLAVLVQVNLLEQAPQLLHLSLGDCAQHTGAATLGCVCVSWAQVRHGSTHAVSTLSSSIISA
eukprot:scaffold47795_cov68-Phaeocystis_antarctica.AAC.3